MLSFNLIYNLEAVAACLKIFMGLALVHFQKYWLLRTYLHNKKAKMYLYTAFSSNRRFIAFFENLGENFSDF